MIQINNTSDSTDNIALLNYAPLALAYIQKIPAKITNNTDSTATFQLSVQQLGKGNVALSDANENPITSVTLPANGSSEITITPTAVSSAPFDVHIIASYNGSQVAEDEMTVVQVTFPQHIRNKDTPAGMADRIPPGVDSKGNITVTPDLNGSGQSVTLTVTGQNDNNGTVIIEGSDIDTGALDITSTGAFSLRGDVQTAPAVPLQIDEKNNITNLPFQTQAVVSETNPNAGNLQVGLMVGGQLAIQSKGFSVSAIPTNVVMEDLGPLTGEYLGILFLVTWSSDSGTNSDLDQVGINEQIQVEAPYNLFEVVPPGEPLIGVYQRATATLTDANTIQAEYISDARASTGIKNGFLKIFQTHEFLDARTGFFNLPVNNSGFVITDTVNPYQGKLYLTTTKEGAATVANGIYSGAGSVVSNNPDEPNIASNTEVVEVLPPGDPLVVTTQPPSTNTSGTGFGFVVTAENADGSVNTSFNGNVTIASYDGNSLGGTLTAMAVNGVASFSGLTEDQAGQDALLVSATGLPTVTTNFFAVTAAPATHLVVSSPSSNVLTNAPFTLEVQAEDLYGNVDPNFNGSVTLALVNSPGGATLGGTLTGTASSGVAAFSGLTISHPGSGYTLRATSTGLTAGTSSRFNVMDQLVVTAQPPQSVTAGSGFGLVVSAEDGAGNVDSSFNGSVTVALNLPSTFGGTLTVTAVNGVATFSGLTVDQAGLYYLSVSANGLATVTTGPVSVTSGQATKLVIQGPNTVGPGNGIPVPFNLDVLAEDAYGNQDLNFNGTVALALANNPSGGTLTGTLTVQAVGGAVTFSGLTIDNIGTGYTLQASSPGLTTGISVPFNVTDQLWVTTPPPSIVTAGTSFGLVVDAVGGLTLVGSSYQGIVDASYNSSVTIALSSFSGSSTSILKGTTTVNAVNGVATFSGLTLEQAGSYGLVVTGNSVTEAAILFDVVSAPANQLVVTTQPQSVTAGAGFRVVIAAEDPSGNEDPTFHGNVTLTLANNPGGATLGGTLTATAFNGVATFAGLTINNSASGYTLQATTNGLIPATTNSIAVKSPGTATQLVVSSQPPSSVTAGSGFGLVVTAKDSFGTVDTSFNGSVTLALANNPSGGTLGGTLTVTAVNGVATFAALTLNQAAQSYSLSATSSGLSAAGTTFFNVNPAAPSQLVVLGPDGNVLTGSPFTLTVNCEDSFGNLASNFNDSVTLALASQPAGILNGTLTARAYSGVATFSGLTINNAGLGYTLQATSTGLTTGISSPFAVTNDRLVVTIQPPGTVTANGVFGLIVSAENGSGNVDASFQGNVTLGVVNFDGKSAILGGTVTVTAVNGVATFSGMTLNQVGTYALSVTSNGTAGTVTNLFNVTAAPLVASQLVVTTQPPTSVTSGVGFNVTFTAEDSSGNVVTTFNGSVTIAPSNNPAAVLATVTAVNGVAFITETVSGSASGLALLATSNGLNSTTTNAFNLTPVGVAAQLVVTSQPPSSVTAGKGFGLVVKAEDDFGTVDSNFNGTVTVVLENQGAPDYALGGPLTATAVNGVATFSNLTVDQAGEYSLSVTSQALVAAATNPFQVTVAPATQLVVAGPSGNVLSGSPFSLAVYSLDPYGIMDPAFNGTVTVSLANNLGGSSLGGALTATAVNGVATFSGLTISNPGSGYTLQVTSNGLTAGTTVPFDVTNDQLVVSTQPPTTVTVQNGFGLLVSAENSSGNVDTSFNGTVTIALSDASSTATLGGTLTVTAVNGVASFAGLTLDQADSYSLSVSSNGLGGATTNSFNVSAAAATQLVVITEPPGFITTGAGFNVTIAAEDPSGNVDPTFNGSVTLAMGNNPGGATLGPLTMTAVNGVATFSDLTINNPGSGYTFQATSTGLTAATSTAMNVTAPGVATQMVVTTQPPSSVTVGSNFGLVIMAEDSSGTVDTNFQGTVTIDNPSDGTPLTQVTAVNGIANFSNLMLDNAGDVALSIVSNGLTGTTTNAFVVNALTATQLVFVGPFSNVLPGMNAFSNALPNAPFGIEVLALDAFGNVNPTFNGPITLALGTNPASGTLGGSLSVTAVNGVATFSGLTIDNPGGGYTMQATSTGLTTGISQPFDVTKDQLVVTTQPPGTFPGGAGFGLIVAAEKANSNLDTSFNASVTVALLNFGSNAPTLEGTLTATAVNGVVTFSGLTLNQAGTYALIVTCAGLGGTLTNPFNVTGTTNAPVRLGFTTAAQTLTAGIASGTIILQLEDQIGNPINASSNLKVNLSSNSGGVFLNGSMPISSVTIVAGSSSASFTYNDSNGGTPTLTVSATGLTPATQQVTVNAGTRTLTAATGGSAISAVTASTTWTPLSGLVYQEGTAQDLASAIGQTIKLDAPSGFVFDSTGAGGPNPSVSVTQVGGAGTTNYAVVYVAGASSSSQLVFNLTALSDQTLDRLTWSNLRVEPSAGTPLASGILTLDSGSTATLVGVAKGTSNLGSLTEVAGAAFQLGFTTAVQTLTAGTTSATITVQLQDRFGNAVKTAANLIVNLSSSSGGVFLNGSMAITSVTIAAGNSSVSFAYDDSTAGTPTLTAAATGLTSGTQQETVQAAVASQLGFTTAAQTLTAGTTSATITVQLQDRFSNAVKAASNLIVNLSSSSGGVFFNGSTPITSLTIAAGSSSLSFAYDDLTAGTPTLTAAATGLTSGTQQETVQAATRTLTAATGGSAISADTTGSSWTPLSGLVYQEGAAQDLASAIGQTIKLDAPSGFVFDNTGADGANPSVSVSQVGGAGTTNYAVVYVVGASTPSQLVFNVTALSVQAIDKLTWSNLRVEPSSGTPLASGIVTVDSGSTATLVGVAKGNTNLGSLTEVAGAAFGLGFATAAQTLPAGITSREIRVQLQDRFGNAVLAGGTLTVNLSSDGSTGGFLSGSTPITSVTIATGSSSASFIYQDSGLGMPTLTASAPGVAVATQQETVEPAPTLTTLALFDGSAGIFPEAGLVQDSSGDFFGTTHNGNGTVYEKMHGSGSLTLLASFNGSDGLVPDARLVLDASGNLFGTTRQGGPNNDGVVFEVAAGSSSITTVASFNGLNGANPWAGLVQDSSGDLFGTTSAGGAYGYGTVFEVKHGSNSITTLAYFSYFNGAVPVGGLVLDSSGDLFGTTDYGGPANDGVVFELAAGSSSITTLASFNGSNGANPWDSLVLDSNGDLYGTTYAGGTFSDGTVFEVSNGSTSITTLASFNGSNGANPEAGLVLDRSGDLFGTTYYGGAQNGGVVFEVAQGSNNISTLASFNFANGENPKCDLILDSTGDLFGTTASGGFSNETAYQGTIFEVMPTSLHLAVTTAPQALTAGAASSPITVQLQDQSGNPVKVSSNLIVNLSSSSSGVFLSGSTPITSVIIAAGTSSASFTYQDTKAGTPTLTAASGSFHGGQVETVKAGPASKLAFTTSPQTLTAGVVSATLTVQLLDLYGNAANAKAALTVQLSSNSKGGLFLKGSKRITRITIAAGSSSASFTYKDTKAGLPTLTAISRPFQASQQVTVKAAPPSKLGFTTLSQTLKAGVVSPAITVQLQDQYGNAVDAGAALTANLSSNSSGGVFLNGSTPITSITIAGGTSSASLTYKDSKKGRHTLIVSAPGLTAASQIETVKG